MRPQPRWAAWNGSRPNPVLTGDGSGAALRTMCSVGEGGRIEVLGERSLRAPNFFGFGKTAHFVEDMGLGGVRKAAQEEANIGQQGG